MSIIHQEIALEYKVLEMTLNSHQNVLHLETGTFWTVSAFPGLEGLFQITPPWEAHPTF